MISTLPNYKLMPSRITNPLTYMLLIAVFMLSACGSSDEPTANSTIEGDNVAFKIPDSLLGSRLDQTAGTLSATISVNGGADQAMTISGTTASVTLSSVPVGATTFIIKFFYDNGSTGGPLQVAQATKTLTVAGGSNALNFAAADFTASFASFDSDGDGISNIDELDENSTSNPVVSLCILDTAALDCELGT